MTTTEKEEKSEIEKDIRLILKEKDVNEEWRVVELLCLIDIEVSKEREKIKTIVAIMREPMPSANAHKQYNRGIREGVELIRNAVITSLNTK